MDFSRGRTAGSPHSRRRPRIALLLVALVLIPGGAWGFEVKGNLDQIANDQVAAEQIIELSKKRLAAIQLEAAIADERNWAVVVLGVEDFNVDNALVTEILGLDIEETYRASRVTVDSLLAQYGPEVTALVEAARVGGDTVEAVASVYGEPEEWAREVGEEAATRLNRIAARTANGAIISERLAYVDSAAAVARALTGEHTNYFGSRYFVGRSDPQRQLRQLVSDRRDFIAATEELLNSPIDSAFLEAELAEMLSSDAVAEFQTTIDEHIQEALTSGLVTIEGDVFTAILTDIDRTTALFNWSIESKEAAIDFAILASADLDTTAAETLFETANQTDRQRSLAIGIAAATLLALALVARYTTRSVRRLAEAAEAIHAGEEVDFKPSGPAEIHRAGQIVSNLGDSVQLVTDQSLALANGSLDDPALLKPARGPLGESLNRAVGTLTASIREREQFRERLAFEADHDGLTGIANRTASTRHLGEALARSERSSTPLAVLYIDLDGFKPINDLHGHRTGDEVLAVVARRLADTARTGDFVGRLGGDEFVLVAEAIGGAADAIGLAHRLRMVAAEPITTLDGTTVTVGASVGVTMAQTGTTPEEVIHDADLALYAAKQSGRNAVALCTDAMREEASQNIDLATAIDQGLADGEFTLHYQPVLNRAGEVESLEALIRWIHEDGSVTAPDSFIPFAEQSDLIVKLDCWVLRRVVRQLADWTDHPLFGHLSIAVNVSGRHLGHKHFVDHIKAPLEDLGVAPERLIVEITETALLQDSYDSVRKLNATRALGVRIAIDDFGTGYTGLTHLRKLPIDIIKIDSEFIARVDDSDSQEAILVRLIVETGHLLGAQITAEGVEEPSQVAALEQLGSDKLQGYLFSRPVAAEDLGPVLQRLAEPIEPPASFSTIS